MIPLLLLDVLMSIYLCLVIDGIATKVKVPSGGVSKGETFQAIFISSESGTPMDNAPQGNWRNGFCSCCKYGLLHPLCCYCFFCSECLLAQVMARMNLVSPYVMLVYFK